MVPFLSFIMAAVCELSSLFIKADGLKCAGEDEHVFSSVCKAVRSGDSKNN